MHWGGMDWSAYLIWMIFMVVMVGGIAAVITLALRRGSEPRSGNAEQILAERFARGEIGEDEYQQRRRMLRS